MARTILPSSAITPHSALLRTFRAVRFLAAKTAAASRFATLRWRAIARRWNGRTPLPPTDKTFASFFSEQRHFDRRHGRLFGRSSRFHAHRGLRDSGEPFQGHSDRSCCREGQRIAATPRAATIPPAAFCWKKEPISSPWPIPCSETFAATAFGRIRAIMSPRNRTTEKSRTTNSSISDATPSKWATRPRWKWRAITGARIGFPAGSGGCGERGHAGRHRYGG